MESLEEIQSRVTQLQENLQQRAEQIVANDPVCAEIRGNIAALNWATGENNDDQPTED
tara:strand:+ start:580 stop:753 length:174 start_codon:yes stop_codon:yes gene_type:complete